MTKPLNTFFDALDADQEDALNEVDFQKARQVLAAQLLEASGMSQQAFGRAIGKSATIVQRIMNGPSRWPQADLVTDALGLPQGMLTDLQSAREFAQFETFIITLDAVVHYQPSALKASKSMPRDFILKQLESTDLLEDDDDRDVLLTYFQQPNLDEQEAIDTRLEGLLENILQLPAQAIRAPLLLTDARKASNRIAVKTRRHVALNVKRLMQEERYTVASLAEKAGRSEAEINALLAPRHKLSLNLLFALAGALTTSPTDLMLDPAKMDAEAEGERGGTTPREPTVVREFLSAFLSLVHETQPGDETEKTGAASAMLVLTPLLHSVVMMVAKNSAMLPTGKHPDLGTVVASFARFMASQR